MLQFHYDFVDRFISRVENQLLEMDTDSLYVALSGSDIEVVVRTKLREGFYAWGINKWFPGQACDEHTMTFQEARTSKYLWTSTTCS